MTIWQGEYMKQTQKNAGRRKGSRLKTASVKRKNVAGRGANRGNSRNTAKSTAIKRKTVKPVISVGNTAKPAANSRANGKKTANYRKNGKVRRASGRRTGIKFFVVVLIVIAFAAATGYIVYADRYERRFIEGTVINNSDVGGLELSEAEEILSGSSDYKLEVDFRDGGREWIYGDSISLGYDFGDGVRQMLAAQDKYRWIEGALGKTRSYTIDNGVHYDEDQLSAIVAEMPEFDPQLQVSPTNARCVRTEDNTFVIESENEGNLISEEAAYACISEAIRQQKRIINLSDTDAYERPTVTADDPELAERAGQLNRFLETTVVYDLPDGGRWTVDRDMLIEWVSQRDAWSENSAARSQGETDYSDADSTGTGNSVMDYYLDNNVISEKCAEAISSLAAMVDDVHTSRTFYATNGRTVEIPGNTYGRQIDQAAETANLEANVLNSENAEREPAYLMNSYPESLNDGTYVEVDLNDQMVYLYKDGGLFFDTPCVSGLSADPERVTITGLFTIQQKERNRTLKGKPDENGVPAYESFVNYWMGFSGSYGLHDATWRDEFGGNIYLYDGSHGCVNLPYGAAETIFNNVEEGTRVIVF